MAEQHPYIVGGTVQAGDGIYLSRRADDELLLLCQQGIFTYVLTPRQLGKSSLMIRTAECLSCEGIRSVIIDLQQLGAQVTAEQWYLGLLTTIEEELDLETDVIEWWQARPDLGVTQRLTRFFQEVLLNEIRGQLVFFVDEIDTTLSLDFTDDFYAAIRYLYLARAHQPEFVRLSFVLVGVATPSDLIRDPKRTPFNIGQRVDLTDFTFEEALPLAEGLGLDKEKAQEVLGWVLDWTQGHPYLTQRLCQALVEQKQQEWSELDVEQVVDCTFFGKESQQDSNLQFVRDMLTKRSPDLSEGLTVYRSVLRDRKPILDEEQSLVKSHLKLSGVVVRKDGVLQVRNPIYKTVFGLTWVREHLPINWAKRLRRAAIASGLIFSIATVPSGMLAIVQRQTAVRALQEAEEARDLAEDKGARLTISLDETEEARKEADNKRKDAEAAQKEEAQQRQKAEAAHKAAEEQRQKAVAAQKAEAQQRQKAVAAQKAEAQQRQKAVAAQKAEAQQRQKAVAAQKTAEEQGAIAESRLVTIEESTNELSKNLNNEITTAIENSREFWSDGNQLIALNHALTAGNRTLEISNSLLGSLLDTLQRDFPTTEFKGQTEFQLKTILAEIHEKNRLEGHEAEVTGISFSPDGRLASSSNDGTIKLWQRNGKFINSFGPPENQSYAANRKGFSKEINEVEFSPDGQYIASTGRDAIVRIWTVDGNLIHSFEGHTEWISDVSFHPDGNILASAGDDHTVRLWYLDGREPDVLKGHTDEVRHVTFSPDKQRLASAGKDGTIRLWSIEGKLLHIFRKAREFQKGTRASEFESRKPRTRQIQQSKTLEPQQSEVREHISAVHFNSSGQLLISGGDKKIQLWDVTGNKLLDERDSDGIIEDVDFRHDGRFVVSSDQNGTVRLWKIVDQSIRKEAVIGESRDRIMAVEFSPDGKLVVSASFDKTIRIWDISGIELSSNQVNSLDELMRQGCAWIKDYLATNPNVSDQNICNF